MEALWDEAENSWKEDKNPARISMSTGMGTIETTGAVASKARVL